MDKNKKTARDLVEGIFCRDDGFGEPQGRPSGRASWDSRALAGNLPHTYLLVVTSIMVWATSSVFVMGKRVINVLKPNQMNRILEI